MFILNVKCDSSMHVDAMTFRGKSVVDYSIIFCNGDRFNFKLGENTIAVIILNT